MCVCAEVRWLEISKVSFVELLHFLECVCVQYSGSTHIGPMSSWLHVLAKNGTLGSFSSHQHRSFCFAYWRIGGIFFASVLDVFYLNECLARYWLFWQFQTASPLKIFSFKNILRKDLVLELNEYFLEPSQPFGIYGLCEEVPWDSGVWFKTQVTLHSHSDSLRVHILV